MAAPAYTLTNYLGTADPAGDLIERVGQLPPNLVVDRIDPAQSFGALNAKLDVVAHEQAVKRGDAFGETINNIMKEVQP